MRGSQHIGSLCVLRTDPALTRTPSIATKNATRCRIGASNLLLEYTLSAAAVARSFTSYSGALISGNADALRLPTGSPLFLIDIPALLIIIALSLLLGGGTQSGARFNTAVTIVNLVVIGFVFAAGAPHFERGNFEPFFPLGLRGAFSGASKVCSLCFAFFVLVVHPARGNFEPFFPLGLRSAFSGASKVRSVCSPYFALCVLVVDHARCNFEPFFPLGRVQVALYLLSFSCALRACWGHRAATSSSSSCRSPHPRQRPHFVGGGSACSSPRRVGATGLLDRNAATCVLQQRQGLSTGLASSVSSSKTATLTRSWKATQTPGHLWVVTDSTGRHSTSLVP